MTKDSNKIGIWGPPVAAVATTNSVSTSELTNNLPPTRRIRWNTTDFFLGIGLMILAQIVMSAWVIFDFMRKNSANGFDLEDTSGITDAILATATSGPFLFISALTMYASWMYAVHRASHKRGLGSLAKDFWLKFNWKRDITIAIVATIVLRGLEQLVSNALVYLGLDMSGADNSVSIVSQTGIWYVLNAMLTAMILAPLFEEIFFRGLFMQALLRLFRQARPRSGDTSVDLTPLSVATGIPLGSGVRLGNVVEKIIAPFYRARNVLAVLISSAVFGFMHFQGTETFGQWFVVIWTGTLGVIMACMVLKTKRLGTAICTHVLYNTSGVLLATFLT